MKPKSFKFYKEFGLWYVDLPEWEGERAELQMVAGADDFLEILAQGEESVYVTLSTEPFNGAYKITLLHLGKLETWEMGTGAWYMLDCYRGITYNLEMWLCDVTVHVFGYFPKEIYFS
jgi:hypothetical protein